MSRVFVVAGEPGVGKTRVAQHIAKRTGGTHLSTDSIRKDLFGPDPEYMSGESQATYDEMFNRARKLLRDGETVVLDGTFSHKAGRERANCLAQKYTDPYEFTIVRVECDPDVTRKRIREREDSDSDADVSIYESIKDRFEPVELPHVTIDNSDRWFFTTKQRLRDTDLYETPSYYQ